MPSLNRLLHFALIGAMVVASVAVSAEARMYKGYELPPYEVVLQDGAIEMRRYRPHVLAEVSVAGDRSGAVSRGFRVLADYIFGGNAERQKVAMTVPVSQLRDDGAGPWKVRFMMPSDYAIESLPTPGNAAIRFVEAGAETQAVIRFSGRWTDRALADQAQRLAAWVDAQGWQVLSEPRYYFYDGPFTLPFNRRNEIALRVAPPAG